MRFLRPALLLGALGLSLGAPAEARPTVRPKAPVLRPAPRVQRRASVYRYSYSYRSRTRTYRR